MFFSERSSLPSKNFPYISMDMLQIGALVLLGRLVEAHISFGGKKIFSGCATGAFAQYKMNWINIRCRVVQDFGWNRRQHKNSLFGDKVTGAWTVMLVFMFEFFTLWGAQVKWKSTPGHASTLIVQQNRIPSKNTQCR